MFLEIGILARSPPAGLPFVHHLHIPVCPYRRVNRFNLMAINNPPCDVFSYQGRTFAPSQRPLLLLLILFGLEPVRRCYSPCRPRCGVHDTEGLFSGLPGVAKPDREG